MRQPMIFSVWHMNRKIFYVACDSESVRSKAQLSFDSSPRRKICSQLLNLYNPNVWTPRILMFLWHKLDDVYWNLKGLFGSKCNGWDWVDQNLLLFKDFGSLDPLRYTWSKMSHKGNIGLQWIEMNWRGLNFSIVKID